MSKITAEDFEPRNLPRLAYKAFSSYFLVMWVLIFMTAVTLLGTLYQADHGLFAAKKTFFHSWFIFVRLGETFPLPESAKWLETLPVFLPGGMLLMVLLTVNLVLGALVKVKKRLRGLGMLVAHSGMILLLAGGVVTFAFNREGNMVLYEGMSSSRVESYREWQVEIIPLGEDGTAGRALVIPPKDFDGLGRGKRRVFQSTDLPFEVELGDYARNAVPVPVAAPVAKDVTDLGPEINGYRMWVYAGNKEVVRDTPAVVARFLPKSGGGEPVETILSARSASYDPREEPMAFGFEMDGKPFAARMVKRTWAVPFTVRLDKFILDRHPGISMARNYESRITRIEGGTDKAIEIKMNEPMRHAGFTFFQESFRQTEAGLISQFAVQNNPSDRWPEWSLWVTGFGLALHFLIKLYFHVARSGKKNTAKPSP